MAEMIRISLKTKRPNGLKNARGRNGYFQAATALIDPIPEETDQKTDNPIIGLEIQSKQAGEVSPIILRLEINEWRTLFHAIEDAHSGILSEE